MTITLVGAGNLASSLAYSITQSPLSLKRIINRTLSRAQFLGSLYEVEYTDDFQLCKQTDVCILAVADKALPALIESTDFGTTLVLHSSGSLGLDIFPKKIVNCGVFYPLQTFSVFKPISLKQVPILIEANTPENEDRILEMAQQMSDQVIKVNSVQRRNLHLSAVFACNYSNHMLAIAYNLVTENGLDFEILKPLILETIEKSVRYNPIKSQTGPALRDDKEVMQMHLALLKDSPYRQIYIQIAESIRQLAEKQLDK